jgi:hypothetical protein
MEFMRIETIGELFTFLFVFLSVFGAAKLGWWLGDKPWKNKRRN